MARAKALPKSPKLLSNFHFGAEAVQEETGGRLGQGDNFVFFSGRERLSWDQETSPRCWVMAEQLLFQLRVQGRAQALQLCGIFENLQVEITL